MPDGQPGAQAWRQMTRDTLAREYSPSSCIGGNYQPFIDAYVNKSRESRLRCEVLGGVWSAHAYGAGAAERLDLCRPASRPAGAGKPGLLVFIHGGYWQELSAQQSLFAAAACIERGQAFAALDYTLAPRASLARIVAECRRAMAWLFSQAQELGFDPGRVVVAGSSAGAHLAAMVALQDGPGDEQRRRLGFELRAVLLVSGIYQLEPLVGTSINDALRLDASAARQHSPALLPLQGFPPALLCWGDNETEEFKRQSRDFAAALSAAGTHCQSFEVAQRNHFDVILDLADPSTRLGSAMLELLGSR